MYLNDGICERTKSLSNSVTSEARSRMNLDCLNPTDYLDVVLNTIVWLGPLRLDSTCTFKLHCPKTLGPSGLEGFAFSR